MTVKKLYILTKKLTKYYIYDITYHLKNIFRTGELEENRTTQKIRVVQNEGNRKVSRQVTFYSLDANYSSWL